MGSLAKIGTGFSATLNNTSLLLTPKRILLYATALTIITWMLFLVLIFRAVELGKKPGVDFVMIYTGAKIAFENPKNLYDVETQREIQRDLIPPFLHTTHWHYNYPPYFSILLMPFGRLEYVPAYWAWTSATVFFYFVSIWLLLSLAPTLRARRRQIFLVATSMPAFVWCTMTGQTTAFSLFVWTLTYCMMKQEQLFISGLTSGLLAFRFHLLILLGPLLFLKRLWNALIGVSISALLLVLAGGLVFSFRSYLEYFVNLRVLSDRIIDGLHPLPKYISLYGFFRLFLPNASTLLLTALAAAALLILFARTWRGEVQLKTAAFDLQFAFTIVATLLLMHHSLVYDLMLLAIPAIIIYQHRSLFPEYYKLILALLYFSPYYSFIIAEKSGVNPVQPLLFWLALEIYQAHKKPVVCGSLDK